MVENNPYESRDVKKLEFACTTRVVDVMSDVPLSALCTWPRPTQPTL